MKKQIISIALGLSTILFSTASFAKVKNVNENATAVTNKTVAVKSLAHLKSVSDDGYTVRTKVGDNDVISAYDKYGNLNYSIEYFTASNLAKNIVDVVKRSYDNYYISGMEKITQPGTDEVYIVHIEDAGSIKTIRVAGGESELVQDFTKG